MYKDMAFSELSKDTLEQIKKGAFLTVKDGDRINTMTIGWGSIGYIWGKPVFIAMVRCSRYTYQLIEKASDFTISLPQAGCFAKQLDFCGCHSGRDCNKFKECGIEAVPGRAVNSPIIDGCNTFIECKIVYKQHMDEELLDDNYKEKWYGTGDYHVMYYGEIVKSYVKTAEK